MPAMHDHPRTVFSGIKPTGAMTLGAYLGALRRFVEMQRSARCVFAVVDLHALTVEHDPDRLRALTHHTAAVYLAAGLDPTASILIRQSDVPEHTELAYLMESAVYVGELTRMIQYKEKGRGRPKTRASLLTYPALMAADILLYRTTEVPVGDDQSQHLELTRDLAQRFNRTYGEVFVVPEMMRAQVAARVMDLQQPTAKMSKSTADDSLGVIRVLDPPDLVRRKVMRAVTDSMNAVRYDVTRQPGVSNLLDILAACRGESDPASLAEEFSSYGELKREVADAVVGVLEPIQKRYADLAKDPAAVEDILRRGADRARALAAPTIAAAKRAIGLSC